MSLPKEGARFLEMPGGELTTITDATILTAELAGLTYWTKFSTIKTYVQSTSCLSYCQRIDITTAEAKLLFTTPIPLIAAPGSGFKVVPTHAYLDMTFAGAPAYSGNALTIYQSAITKPIFETNAHLSDFDVDCSFLDVSNVSAENFVANTDTLLSVPTANLISGTSNFTIRITYQIWAV